MTGKFSRLDVPISGIRTSRCSLCHELFSGEAAFVLHRINGTRVGGNPGEYFLGTCRHPESKGMTLGRNGVWKQ
jgi:hypothetical protein